MIFSSQHLLCSELGQAFCESISIKKSVEYEVVYWRQVSTDLIKPLAFTSISDNLLLKDPGSMKQNKLPRNR